LVILLDYNMPGMSAEDFMAALRQRYQNPNVILITASGDAKKLAQQLHINYWFSKPFDYDSLFCVLRNLSVMPKKTLIDLKSLPVPSGSSCRA
jgi:CheY-like chemotaxis protein